MYALKGKGLFAGNNIQASMEGRPLLDF